ncbi:FecR family protein [Hymenobacter sp. HD11105]
MKQANFKKALHRYLQGESPPAEARLVEQWYQDLNESSPDHKLSPADHARLKAALWSRIQHNIQAPATTQVSVRIWDTPVLRWAVAAILVLGLGFGGFQLLRPQQSVVVASRPAAPHLVSSPGQTQWITRTNPTNQVMQLALGDGSTVALQPSSSLRYPPLFTGAQREVHLQGEAFFEVAHNPAKPFLVFTDKLVTRVLGTSFTVRAFPDQRQAVVMVRTGRVQVSPRASSSKGASRRVATPLELIPNQQVAYSPEVLEMRKELVERPALLNPRPFAFDDRPVTEVIRALEQAYGVPIVYDAEALEDCTVRLIFKEEPLFEKLDLLCKALGASYERAGTKVLFYSKGCRSKLGTPSTASVEG